MLSEEAPKGPLRPVPCLGCVRSALAGMSLGDCYSTPGSARRCVRCGQGGTCKPLPDLAVRASLTLVGALAASADVSDRSFFVPEFVNHPH